MGDNFPLHASSGTLSPITLDMAYSAMTETAKNLTSVLSVRTYATRWERYSHQQSKAQNGIKTELIGSTDQTSTEHEPVPC
jgi:hypothetical protein